MLAPLRRLRLALPSQCAICRCWPTQRLCPDCCTRNVHAVARCRSCALPVPEGVAVCGVCLREPPPLERCVAVLDYAWPWRAVLAEFKFRGDAALAHSLAALLLQSPPAQALLAQCDALVPMPLSVQRLRERGFHQTLHLARALERQTPIAVWAHAVQRRHTAQAQHTLTRAQRLRQLRTVFTVAASQQAPIVGRTLLLLDDVMTTGASLCALARCLRQAGAAAVHALVLARTPLE